MNKVYSINTPREIKKIFISFNWRKINLPRKSSYPRTQLWFARFMQNFGVSQNSTGFFSTCRFLKKKVNNDVKEQHKLEKKFTILGVFWKTKNTFFSFKVTKWNEAFFATHNINKQGKYFLFTFKSLQLFEGRISTAFQNFIGCYLFVTQLFVFIICVYNCRQLGS